MSYSYKPTQEQEKVINSIKDAVEEYIVSFDEKPKGARKIIKSSAGTGKSSTIIFSLSSINDIFKEESEDQELYDKPNTLYIVLNAGMRVAMSKTIEKIPELSNVQVTTFHKFMLDHIKETFPEMSEKIEYNRKSLGKDDLKVFLDALFKKNMNFRKKENRIAQSTLLNSMDRYLKIYLSTEAINSIEMIEKISMDDKYKKIFSKVEDIEETNNFLTPYANVLYDNVYKKNPDFFNKILNTTALKKEEMSELDNFTKMIGHFLINKILDYKSDIPITHDVYFKIAYVNAIKNKKLDLFSKYASVYVDEGQDQDRMMLAILDTASPVVSYFGDSDQQLYSFKGSVDSLEYVEKSNKGNVEVLELTESFRYKHDIAVFASFLLNETKDKNINIKGRKTEVSNTINQNLISDKNKLHEKLEDIYIELSNVYKNPSVRRRKKIVVISRTNKNVLKNTLEFLRYKEEKKSSINCSIEGDFKKKIRGAISGKYPPELLKDLNDATEGNIKTIPLESYRENPKIVSVLEGTDYSFLVDKNLSINDLKLLANARMGEVTSDVIFLSTHQAKGKEYPYIFVDNDFMPRKENEGLYDIKNRVSRNPKEKKLFFDEVNMAYVAITRAQKSLFFYKENNLLYDFYKEKSAKIENELGHYTKTEFFDNGYSVIYSKSMDEKGNFYYTKDISDQFGNSEWYEISYEKPDENNNIMMDKESGILKNTTVENGKEIFEYKFLSNKVFKKEFELTKNEIIMIEHADFKNATDVQFGDNKNIKKKQLKIL